MNLQTPYTAIAAAYANHNALQPIQKDAAYPSLFNSIGDVRGKTVLDLACGEGIVAREMYSRGAKHVVALDECSEMLDIAESRHPSGASIEYWRAHVGDLGAIGQFDIVTGAYLLHYAKPRDELFRMCRDIRLNLRRGGTFFGINNNPEHLFCFEPDPDKCRREKPEGIQIKWIFWAGGINVPFTNYYYRKSTYEEALGSAGLSVEWVHITPTDEGRRSIAPRTLSLFLRSPWLVILKCVKK